MVSNPCQEVGNGGGTEAVTWCREVWSLGGLLSELFDLRSHRHGDTFRVVSPTTSYNFPPLPAMTHSHPAVVLDRTDLVASCIVGQDPMTTRPEKSTSPVAPFDMGTNQ